MNHNYHMARFAAQERMQKLQSEAQMHRDLQTATSQEAKSRFALQFNRLHTQIVKMRPIYFLTSWQPGQAIRKLIYKYS